MIYQCDGAASVCSSEEGDEEVDYGENEAEPNENYNEYGASDIESITQYEDDESDIDEAEQLDDNDNEQSNADESENDEEHNIPVNSQNT